VERIIDRKVSDLIDGMLITGSAGDKPEFPRTLAFVVALFWASLELAVMIAFTIRLQKVNKGFGERTVSRTVCRILDQKEQGDIQRWDFREL